MTMPAPPPATRTAGQSGHIIDHNTISSALTALETAVGTLQSATAPSGLLVGLAPVGTSAGGGDAANINGLINLGSTKVILQPGQYWLEAPVILKDHTWVDGAGDGITFISPAAGANCDVFQGQSFSALTGTGTATLTGSGPVDIQVSNLTIDGNRSAQTLAALTNSACNPATAPSAGYGLRLYGRDWKLANLGIRNCAAYGVWTEWGTGASNAVYTSGSVEGRAVNVKVYNNAAHGWYHRGPSDSEMVNIVAFQNNAAGLSAGIDFWAESDGATNGSGTSHFTPNGLQLSNCHFWGTTARWNLVLDCNASAANCHAEGAAVGCALLRGSVRWTGGSQYYIPGQVSSWGLGVQLGDTGSTAGVPTTANYTASVALFETISGTLCDIPARAGIVWANANQSILDVQVVVRSAPTATVAAGSNGVSVATFTAGSGTLSYAGGTGMPPTGGTVTVATSGGTATVTYTGISGGNTLTGCTTTAGSGTLSTGGSITLANTGTAAVTGSIDAASDVSIEVTGSGLASGVVQAASRHYSRGLWRHDAGSASQGFYVTNNGADVLNVNSASKRIELVNGQIMRFYSDSYATKTFDIDGAKGHLVSYGPNPAVAVVSNAGTGAPAPTVSSLATDVKGQVSMGTGTGPASGAQAAVTFAAAYTNTPTVVLTAANFATSTLAPYVTGASASGFSVAFGVAPGVSQPAGTYAVNYHVLGS